MGIRHDSDQRENTASLEERLSHLAKQGLLTLPKKEKGGAFPHVERATVKGEPLSETIVRERR